MQTVVVLFNLKPGVVRAEYEAWARSSDLPVVNGLASVDRFEVLKASCLLVGEAAAPYAYAQLIRVPDTDAFSTDLSDPAGQAGAAQFQQYADNPLFILTHPL